MAPRLSLSFTEIQKLVKEVKSREFLWNNENEAHNDRYRTAKAWSEISEATKLPATLVRSKWKNLRDMFMKEVKRFPGVTLDTYRGSWRYFKSLFFLYRPDDTQHSDSEQTKEYDDEECHFVKIEVPNSDDDFSEAFQNSMEEGDPIITVKNKTSRKEDYDLMFLKSLVPYFKELTPLRKLVVRSKIQDMLMNELAAQSSSTKYLKS